VTRQRIGMMALREHASYNINSMLLATGLTTKSAKKTVLRVAELYMVCQRQILNYLPHKVCRK